MVERFVLGISLLFVLVELVVFGQVFTAISAVLFGCFFSAMPAGAAAFVRFAAAVLAFDKPAGTHSRIPAVVPMHGDTGCAEQHAKSQGDMYDADKHGVRIYRYKSTDKIRRGLAEFWIWFVGFCARGLYPSNGISTCLVSWEAVHFSN